MSTTALSIPFSNDVDGDGSIWARLEQEYKPSAVDKTSVGDISEMFGRAVTGLSAFTYIDDACSYAVVENDTVTVNLDIYVWPSSLDLVYTLKADLGTISDPEVVEEHRSFDVPFNGTSKEQLPYLFEGTFEPEMPFILSDGSVTDVPDHTVEGSSLVLDSPGYSVFRADGVATGFKHTVTMVLVKAASEGEHVDNTWAVNGESILMANGYDAGTFPVIHNTGAEEKDYEIEFVSDTEYNLKDNLGELIGTGTVYDDLVTDYLTLRAEGWSDDVGINDALSFSVVKSDSINLSGYKIENVQNTITLSYMDETGKRQTEAMELAIPPCVAALLAECPDGKSVGVVNCQGRNCNKEGYFVVYVSNCTGSILLSRWEVR